VDFEWTNHGGHVCPVGTVSPPAWVCIHAAWVCDWL